MKKGLLILILLLCLQVITFAVSDEDLAVVAGNWHIQYVNPEGKPANDFHVCGIIGSRDNVMPKLKSHAEFVVGGGVPWYLAEYTIEKVPNHSLNWYFTAHFQTDQTIAPGTMMHFGLYFLANYCNKAVVNCAYWTYFKEAVGRAPVIGFDIFGRGIINLFNTADIPLQLANLEVAVIPRPIPLEQMMTDQLGNPGQVSAVDFVKVEWRKLASDTAIKPNSTLKISLQQNAGLDIQEGQFLLIRGYTISQNVKLPFWIQHEEMTK